MSEEMSVPPPRPRSETPYARLLGVALLAGALVQLVLSAAAPSPAEGAKGERLEAGKPIDREIRSGETHVYEVDVPAGRIVNGVIDQRGVDVTVRVVDPTGATIATLDSPNGVAGPEPWSLDGKAAGLWRLEVSPFPGIGPGRYEARIDEIITPGERDERAATIRYQSPRLLQLWKDRRAGGVAAVDRFAKEVEGHAPLVEPIDGDPRGDVLLTFLYRTRPETRYVGLLGGPTGANEVGLLRFEDTDLSYLTLRAPKDARFTYRFRRGDPPNAGATRKERPALYAGLEADPWNPRHFAMTSLVDLPGAPAQPRLQRAEGVPAGRVVEKTIHSAILGEDRKLGVYLPAAYSPAGGPYPYVIVFDGEVYGAAPEALVPTPIILDNLIAEGKLPPTLAVLLNSGGTRDRDLPMSAPFGEFLATELAPWVRRELRGADDPAKVTLAGSSFGGLCAAYCAFHHADVFGNALSQSGSFWFSPGALEAEAPHHVETGALMSEIAAAPRQPLRIWMEVGRFEGGGGLFGSNQVAQNRHMRDVLLAKGYSVSYHEFSGGHDYACWRGSLADGLIALGDRRAMP
jgi:enterochelin esterase-like enzyme